jgi:hypothetical protein
MRRRVDIRQIMEVRVGGALADAARGKAFLRFATVGFMPSWIGLCY